MKALEDLAIQYDGTVRQSSGGVFQFTYGDDSFLSFLPLILTHA
jgi:DNA-directed RNA polymerase III subunit RPC1